MKRYIDHTLAKGALVNPITRKGFLEEGTQKKTTLRSKIQSKAYCEDWLTLLSAGLLYTQTLLPRTNAPQQHKVSKLRGLPKPDVFLTQNSISPGLIRFVFGGRLLTIGVKTSST